MNYFIDLNKYHTVDNIIKLLNYDFIIDLIKNLNINTLIFHNITKDNFKIFYNLCNNKYIRKLLNKYNVYIRGHYLLDFNDVGIIINDNRIKLNILNNINSINNTNSINNRVYDINNSSIINSFLKFKTTNQYIKYITDIVCVNYDENNNNKKDKYLSLNKLVKNKINICI